MACTIGRVQKNFPTTLRAHLAGIARDEKTRRDLVPGRGADRPEERPRTTMGGGAERGRASPPISATRAPTCSARSVRLGARAQALALPFADSEAMQLHLNEIARHCHEGGPCRPAARPSWVAHDLQPSLSRETSPSSSCRLAPQSSTRSRTSGSTSRELALKPRLRNLRRHRRGLPATHGTGSSSQSPTTIGHRIRKKTPCATSANAGRAHEGGWYSITTHSGLAD